MRSILRTEGKPSKPGHIQRLVWIQHDGWENNGDNGKPLMQSSRIFGNEKLIAPVDENVTTVVRDE